MTPREHLQSFLQEQIDEIEADDEPDKGLLSVLYSALDGLFHLDYGEVDEIFKPKSLKNWGVRPGTAKALQAEAVGLTRVFEEFGHTVSDAEMLVAKAMGIESNTIHQWKKTIGKSTDGRLKTIRDLQIRRFSDLQKLGHPPPEHACLDHAKRMGIAFATARNKKTGKN